MPPKAKPKKNTPPELGFQQPGLAQQGNAPSRTSLGGAGDLLHQLNDFSSNHRRLPADGEPTTKELEEQLVKLEAENDNTERRLRPLMIVKCNIDAKKADEWFDRFDRFAADSLAAKAAKIAEHEKARTEAEATATDLRRQLEQLQSAPQVTVEDENAKRRLKEIHKKELDELAKKKLGGARSAARRSCEAHNRSGCAKRQAHRGSEKEGRRVRSSSTREWQQRAGLSQATQ
ncbi:hypothetical protein K402DRAFT_93929 [Aulographum hederae CBS 113979]|uniref:Uncharacterized protein n=1 Tax=Aulographum hederae CBS 113979 TaxID=1176131 RepID=A0A6G1GZW7_9PEZI|nr:hypothetical protein K402DRAFT_93929 [Aulographum hederae CBS 113979]